MLNLPDTQLVLCNQDIYYKLRGDRCFQMIGTWISILLDADDIVLIADSHEGLLQHLDTLTFRGIG